MYDIKSFLTALMFQEVPKENRTHYYQSKLDYYRHVLLFCVFISCITEILYYFSDCACFGRFETETIIPRLFILVPLAVFFIVHSVVNNYVVTSIMAVIICNACHWCTIWVCFYLPTTNFAREGFIIMHFMFLSLGIALPRKYVFAGELMIPVNIIISNYFIHYEYFGMMLLLSFPLIVSVQLFLVILELSFKDIYENTEMMKHMYYKDQLTGTFNRYKLESLFETEEYSESNNTFIAMLDIDDFKKVNDTYGHKAGDAILTAVSGQISKNISNKDFLIRFGGEEFLILLPDAEPKDVEYKLEHIRSTVANLKTDFGNITISIGYTHFQQGENYELAIKRADSALYYVKANGKNAVKADTDC